MNLSFSYKKTGLKSLLYLIFLSFLNTSTWAQKAAFVNVQNQQMTSHKQNFTSLSKVQVSQFQDSWALFNPEFKQHPEYGVHAYNAPKGDLVEVLNKREVDSRYYINPQKPSEFFIQKSVGDLHFKKGNQWLTINPHLQSLGKGVYEAERQPEPVGISTQDGFTYINTPDGKVTFNRWELYGINDDNSETRIAVASWNQFTVGDDGVYVKDIFTGIDATMMVLRGSIKTSFIVHSMPQGSYKGFILKDAFELNTSDAFMQFKDFSDQSTGAGKVIFKSTNNKPIVEVGEAIAYVENKVKETFYLPEYQIHQNKIGIVITQNWLRHALSQGTVIIDPLVSSSNTLAQGAITGSRYNATCDFTNSCDYSLNVNTPTAATFTDILFDFDYIAQGICVMADGAMRITLGSCISPNQTGYYWFCNDPFFSGTCYGTGISVYNELNTCLPLPSCSPQSLTFGLKFYRSCWGVTGCNGNCIGAASPWTITIQGQTVSFTNPAPNQFNVSTTTICQGGNISTTLLGTQYGVPPYSVNWSLSPSGTPSVGTGNTANINFPTAGPYTIYCIVTDACGQTATASKAVTITPPPAPPTVTSPVSYCQNATASVLTAIGSSLQWYTVPVGGTPTGAPTPSTGTPGTVSYYVSQTIGGCESPRAQIDVIVNAYPTFGGGASATPASCGGSDGSISGLTASGSLPFTFTWYNSVPAVVSTSNLNADLNNQPAGSYTLTVTDANGCTNSYGPVVINSAAPPAAPVVSSPVNYCQGATAVALTAVGSNLLWYTTPSGGTGSATAPVPSTGAPGTTSYYVSQTVSGCESVRAQIDVIVTAAPSPPTVSTPVNLCQGSTPNALTATGSSLLWYTVPTGGTGSATAPTPSTATTGSTSYYVSQTIGGCESSRAQITVQVNPNPVISGTPTITPSNCGVNTGGVTGYSATGTGTLTYTWTNAAMVVVSTSTLNADLSNQPAGSYTLTVTDAQGCSVTSSVAQITNNTGPSAPTVVSPVNYCEGDVATQLSATGVSLLWYLVPGGTGSATAPTPTTAVAGTTSYYVTQTASGCESPASQIDVIVTATPAAPSVVSPINYCQGATATALTATGNNLLWYTTPTGGTGSATAPVPSTAIAGNTSYYVSQSTGSCESTRAQITIQINAIPVISGTPNVSPNSCGQTNGAIGGLSATGTGTLTYTWTDALGTVVSTSTSTANLSNQGAGTYTLTITDGQGCTASSAPIQITNTSAPPAPTVVSPVTYCIGSTAVALTATGTGLLWYTVLGGSGSATAPIPTTSVAGTTSYYVTQTQGGCESLTAQIDVIVSAQPNAPSVVSPVSYCQGAVASPLTASGTGLVWYTSPTGGTGVPTLTPSTAIDGTTSYYVSQSVNGCESPRTEIVVIVNPSVSPVATITSTDVNVCQGTLISFSAIVNDAGTNPGMQWMMNGAPIAGETSLNYSSNTLTGNAVISFQVTSTVACANPTVVTSNTITVNVMNNATPAVTLSAEPATACIGKPISITANPVFGGTNPQFSFQVNGVAVQSGANPVYTDGLFFDGDIVTVIMSSNYPCINGSNTVTSSGLPIHVALPPTVNATAATDTIINGQSTVLTGVTNAINPQFLWEPATALVCDICESTDASPNETIDYYLTVTDLKTGCVGYDTLKIYVSNEFSIFIPTAFSPNFDGVNDDLFVRGVGIKEFTLNVYDRWGLIVFTTSDQKVGWNGTFNDKPVVPGVYTFYLKYEKYDGSFDEIKGNITLVR